MYIDDLIRALSRLGIAEVRSKAHCADGVRYVLCGRLPTPPIAPRYALITYELLLADSTVVSADAIESLLLHLWQGQRDLSDLKRAATLGAVAPADAVGA